MTKSCIGSKIKALRTQSGFNQATIADYLQVDQSLISKIESGEREASTDIIKKLSMLFGCKESHFIEDGDDSSCLNISFRTKDMTIDDLKSIAIINKIALNLDYMQELLEAQENEKH